MSRLFPVFLKLEGREVLLVGGGPVAAGKLTGLLASGASVTVVAPEVLPEIEAREVSIERRAFRPEDLLGVFFVVAAAPPSVNREVLRAAEESSVFVNAVDDPASASAYAAGVLHRGGVTIAISTDGEVPALAGLLREALEAVLPDELETWVQVAREARREWKAAGAPFEKRRPLLLHALNRIYERQHGLPEAAGRTPS